MSSCTSTLWTSENHLLGVIDLKELLQADDKAPLSGIMIENVISLDAGSTLKEASTGI